MIELINWILEEGRDSDDLGAILKGVSERLVAQGIPLCRTNLSMPTIDPTAAVVSFLWSHDKGPDQRDALARGCLWRPVPAQSDPLCVRAEQRRRALEARGSGGGAEVRAVR
jgi:hypothetical protein